MSSAEGSNNLQMLVQTLQLQHTGHVAQTHERFERVEKEVSSLREENKQISITQARQEGLLKTIHDAIMESKKKNLMWLKIIAGGVSLLVIDLVVWAIKSHFHY